MPSTSHPMAPTDPVRWLHAKRRNSAASSRPFGRSSKFMSKPNGNSPDRGPPSEPYSEWLLQEQRARRSVKIAQCLLLMSLLILWEILPRAHLLNPLFTSYPSALWPTFLELVRTTPQQASILVHTLSTLFATLIGFSMAMMFGTVIAAALWW